MLEQTEPTSVGKKGHLKGGNKTSLGAQLAADTRRGCNAAAPAAACRLVGSYVRNGLRTPVRGAAWPIMASAAGGRAGLLRGFLTRAARLRGAACGPWPSPPLAGKLCVRPEPLLAGPAWPLVKAGCGRAALFVVSACPLASMRGLLRGFRPPASSSTSPSSSLLLASALAPLSELLLAAGSSTTASSSESLTDCAPAALEPDGSSSRASAAVYDRRSGWRRSRVVRLIVRRSACNRFRQLETCWGSRRAPTTAFRRNVLSTSNKLDR